jgi:anti-sigma B factor antagonist
MEIQIESHSENVTLVTLIGKLDLMGAQAIDTRLGATANRGDHVVVDLQGVTFLASMGIRSLVMAAKAAQLKGRRLVVIKASVDVEQVLLASGLDSLIPMTASIEAAVALCQS